MRITVPATWSIADLPKASPWIYVKLQKCMDPKTDKNKIRLQQAMKACVENGQRLHDDAEWLGSERSATAIALCILAQEEFAKAFLLHLVCEEIIPWTANVRKSLHDHRHKQLIGLIMEWLSPSDDAFMARLEMGPGTSTIPVHVADAAMLYVEKVLSQGNILYPQAPLDPVAKRIAAGDRDRAKQDSLYVNVSDDAEVISIPSPVADETVQAEFERTKRLGDLVKPLREGALGPVLDYDLLVETMRFLLLDKRNRPFLLLGESRFGEPQNSSTAPTSSHSIEVRVENISNEQALRVDGHAALFLDKTIVKPTFLFNQFTLDPYTASVYSFSVPDETYTRGISVPQNLHLHIDLKYHGSVPDRKYHAKLWSTYDPSNGCFRETFTDVQEAPVDPSLSLETRWTRPSRR